MPPPSCKTQRRESPPPSPCPDLMSAIISSRKISSGVIWATTKKEYTFPPFVENRLLRASLGSPEFNAWRIDAGLAFVEVGGNGRLLPERSVMVQP